MTDQEKIKELIKKARVAVEAVEDYTQEQADTIARAVGKIVYDNCESLSEEAATETGMGTKEDKIEKHFGATALIWEYLKNKPSVGVLSEDKENKTMTFAKPMGVIASICPSTNPTTTAVFTAMNALKGLNAVIVAAHPRAKNCSHHCVELMRQALAEVGAPVDLVQEIAEPTIELSGLLMDEADAIVAVGGAGMVKAAYSHGTPAFGVGQGNVQTIVGENYDDFDKMAESIVLNRCFDDGVPCTGDQTVYVPRKNKEKIIAAFEKQGAYLEKDEAKINAMREHFFGEKGINRDIVGKLPKEACAAVGIDIPECKVVMVELGDKYAQDEILCKEILFPILRIVTYDDFDTALKMARANLFMEGAGHSSSIWSKDEKEIFKAGKALPVGRLSVEQMNSESAGNPCSNGLPPTMAIGCGTWGGNSICENLTYYHMLNKTIVHKQFDVIKEPTIEEIWQLH